MYVCLLVIAVSVITQEFICYHDDILLNVISTVGYIFSVRIHLIRQTRQ